MNGSFNTFKYSLVAKDYWQKDTYAPVVRITSIRILFTLASINDLHIHRMDVKTTFLNYDLDRGLYETIERLCSTQKWV